MASNLKHPFGNPPSYSSAGEKEIESEEDEEAHQRTIFSSDEDEPEDPPPRSSGEAQMCGRKRLSEGISTNLNSKQAKKTGSNTKQASFRRLFSEKDEIVLLQGIVDYKGQNPLEDKRSFYESMKGSFSFDVTLVQFADKIRSLMRKYTRNEMRGEEVASVLDPHQQKCFQLSKAIWGAEGIAFEPAKGKSEKSVSKKKRDLVTSRKAKNNNVQDGSQRRDMKRSPHVVTESDWDESSFFLGMDFLKEKWTKVPTETKKETQEKMRKLHAHELECQRFEEMLKAMKDKCACDKVELLNEVTSLIMATD
ncbi:hypothetical protein Bca4012_083676 [Brassica carinata]|uniref:Glabrous enhancer-binding protein-like DBD domain-containing protein n=1 Tax=Brassica carinata TaxID=52824 RepID=A0A8X7SJ12_BRACI|nr:hypothetical protein Bca52824_027056 [Brassica carinata]